jgi:hypothetical protein
MENREYFYHNMALTFRLLILAGLMAGCHSPKQQAEASPAIYDSSIATPGGKDPAGGKASKDSVEAQINGPDSVFEDGSRPTTWANAGFGSPARFKRFLVVFKGWVKRDRVDSISAHIRYPIRGAGSAAWFKEQYPHIFTRHLKLVISHQRLDRIFRNGQGAMVGNGDLWFIEDKGRYWVTAVN